MFQISRVGAVGRLRLVAGGVGTIYIGLGGVDIGLLSTTRYEFNRGR